MATPSAGPVICLPSPEDVAGGGFEQAGDDAQQGGFAGAGTAEQADDFAGVEGDVDVIEDDEVAGGVLVVGLLAVADFEQGVWC